MQRPRWLVAAVLMLVMTGGAGPAAAQTASFDVGRWEHGGTAEGSWHVTAARTGLTGSYQTWLLTVRANDGGQTPSLDVNRVLFQFSTVAHPAFNSENVDVANSTMGIDGAHNWVQQTGVLPTTASLVPGSAAPFLLSNGDNALVANLRVLTTTEIKEIHFRADRGSAVWAGRGTVTTVDASAVPEPSAALLFLPALGVVTVLRRRKN